MLIDIPENGGYAALAGLVAVEASGVPVPGETALITAAAELVARLGVGAALVVAAAALAVWVTVHRRRRPA